MKRLLTRLMVTMSGILLLLFMSSVPSHAVGPTGKIVGMRRFGASAPIKDLQKKFGFTAENVVVVAREAIAQAK